MWGWLSWLAGSGAGAVFGGARIATGLAKDRFEKKIPAEFWRNKDLMDADKLDVNVSPEQVMKNLESGKYYLPDYPIGFDMKYEKEYEEDKQIHGFLYAYKKAARGEYGKARKLQTVIIDGKEYEYLTRYAIWTGDSEFHYEYITRDDMGQLVKLIGETISGEQKNSEDISNN